MKHMLNIVIHHETLVIRCDDKALDVEMSAFGAATSAITWWSFDAEMSALDMETFAFGAATSAIARKSFDAMILALDGETLALSAEFPAISVIEELV